MKRKLICILLTAAMLLGFSSFALASESTAKLYTVYGDGMLLAQYKEAIFAGTGTPNSIIKVQLLNENSWPVRTGTATVDKDGTFEVSFIAPEGSFKEYTVTLTQDGDTFATLENVVFGELWIASGQSNMMYPLAQAETGSKMFEEKQELSPWLRVFIEPAYPTYNGTNAVPADPQNNIIGGEWISGTDEAIYSMSAVGYFFAEKLMKELNVPIGILNSSLGGSAIATWLSRDAIENDNVLKQEYIDEGIYIEKSDWNENSADIYNDMTCNYNLRTHAYRNFRPSGLIWYQGETDLINGRSHSLYSHSLDALQQMFTEMFNCKDELFPIVYTQIAATFYPGGSHSQPDWNINYSEIQKSQPDHRAMITLYDLPLTFIPELGLIHPEHKKPVGERMAQSALGLVYGKTETYSAAIMSNYEIKNGSIYVTFDNVGSGLRFDGKPEGFAICGKDGVYIQADAEIVSKDTVRIFSDKISEPIAATYAYGVSNMYSNLYANNLPVSLFVTKKFSNAHYWLDNKWADCEYAEIWHNELNECSGYYSAWYSDNATLEITNADAYSGKSSLKITSDDKKFTIKPTMTYEYNKKACSFYDIENDYSDYNAITFRIMNNGTEDITFEKMKIYTSKSTWYSPAADKSVIPADGQWYTVTLDLDSLYLYGNKCGFTYANEKLTSVREFEIELNCANGNADINIDAFEFAPSAEKVGTRFEANIANAGSFIEFISAVFTTVIGVFANIFNN